MEVWKDIKGFEGCYQVSNYGRVKSLERYVHCGAGGKGQRLVPEKILKPGRYCKSGHLSVVLGKGKAGKPVHQLVAESFIGPRPKGMDVCHNDGDPTNNKVLNLRYDTRSNNNIDAYLHGKKMGTGKLDVLQVKNIKQMLLSKDMSQKELAIQFGISETQVSKIKLGKAFKWVIIE